MIDFQQHAELITPELAAALLEKNPSNRPVSKSTVYRYATQIKQGTFEANGESIIISSDGELLDGQHRLMAVVQAKMPIIGLIVSNVPKDVFHTIDAGKTRNAADVLAIGGHKNWATLAKVARQLICFREDLPVKATASGYAQLSAGKLLEFADANPKLAECVSAATTLYSIFSAVRQTEYALMLYLFSQKNQEAANSFCEKLAYGQNLTEAHDSAILLVRRKFIDLGMTRRKASDEERLALLISAWNRARAGGLTKSLKWLPEHGLPKIA